MKLLCFTTEDVIRLPFRRFLSPPVLGAILCGIFCFHLCADATNCVPRPPGLVSWWRAEGNGQDSEGTNHGTLINSVSFEPGMVGQAFRMVANPNPRIFVPDNPTLELTNSISIEGWIKTDFGGGWLLNRGDDTVGEVPYGVAFYDAFRLHFIIAPSANNWLSLPAPTPIPSNSWVHFAATLDGDSGDMRLYVNGQLVAQTNTTLRPICPLTGANRSVVIGNAAGASAGFPFAGFIDEIALYSRALTETEVQSIHAAGSAGKCRNPATVSISLHAGVTLEGVVGLTYGIQSSTNLDNAKSWLGVANVTLSTPTMIWIDIQPATQTQRYYRVVPGPIPIP